MREKIAAVIATACAAWAAPAHPATIQQPDIHLERVAFGDDVRRRDRDGVMAFQGDLVALSLDSTWLDQAPRAARGAIDAEGDGDQQFLVGGWAIWSPERWDAACGPGSVGARDDAVVEVGDDGEAERLRGVATTARIRAENAAIEIDHPHPAARIADALRHDAAARETNSASAAGLVWEAAVYLTAAFAPSTNSWTQFDAPLVERFVVPAPAAADDWRRGAADHRGCGARHRQIWGASYTSGGSASASGGASNGGGSFGGGAASPASSGQTSTPVFYLPAETNTAGGALIGSSSTWDAPGGSDASTAVTPVPLPGGFLLLFGAVAMFGFVMRGRRAA